MPPPTIRDSIPDSPGATAPVDFFASRNSLLVWQRRFFWLVALTSTIVACWLMHDLRVIAVAVVSSALLCGLAEFLLRRQLRPGKPVVTLDETSITSPNLSGKRKILLWKDIEFACILMRQGRRHIEFRLRKPAGQRDRRSFWTGINNAAPLLSLRAFSREDQERLFSEILDRHIKSCSAKQIEQLKAPLDELRENNAFEDRLEAMQPHTWITWGLIGLNVAIWLLTLMHGAGFVRSSPEKLLLWGGNAASEVQKGQWWRLLTATFLHSGFIHVTMNMLGLYSIGIWVERIYGKRLYIFIYLASGLLGSVSSLHFSAQSTVSVGASGAIFGIAGALIVAVAQHRTRLPKLFSQQMLSSMGLFVMFSLLQGFGKPGIDNAAHVGGLIGGGLMAFLLPERFDLDTYRRVLARRAIVTALVVAVVAMIGIRLAPQAALDLGRIGSGQEIMMRGLQKFDRATLELRQEIEALKSGKLTEQESDARSRAVMAPKFRDVVADLSQVVMRPDDPGAQFVRDIKRTSELLAEQLEMKLVFDARTQRYEPIDPERVRRINAELMVIGQRVGRFSRETLSNKR